MCDGFKGIGFYRSYTGEKIKVIAVSENGFVTYVVNDSLCWTETTKEFMAVVDGKPKYTYLGKVFSKKSFDKKGETDAMVEK